MSQNYQSEREGQLKFFDKFAIKDTELANNTDGIYGGTIFEFKRTIPNVSTALFQAIKYLSHMRIKGVSIPSSILLVALNEEVAYLFKSSDYLLEIETVYAGAASKNNAGFRASTSPESIHYDSPKGIGHITEILAETSFIKVHIDVFDVVGWSERFYRENPSASKIKLFEELRKPVHFESSIYPWTGDEKDFKYIMDLLNDKEHKKELGAFYTPPAYCRKAIDLVRNAISQVPKEHEYIILDRCAGTGNLEEFLTDKAVDDITVGQLSRYINEPLKADYLKDKASIITAFYTDNNFNDITVGELEKYKTNISLHDFIYDNELSHVIVNTYELKEWIVLNERIGDRVKLIIPPPQEINNTEALVDGGDALSAQFILGQKSLGMTDEYSESIGMLLDYVKDDNTNIILYENPPYSDVGAVMNNSASATKKTAWKKSFVSNEIKIWIKENRTVSSRASNDLANLFIWSGFKYYIRKPHDSYIVFSPPKYIKSQHLINKEMAEGYIFNRIHFHANSSSAISCVRWKNQEKQADNYQLEVLDIQEDDQLISSGKITIKKVYKNLSTFYDKYDESQYVKDIPGVVLDWSGKESEKHYSRVRPIYNTNLIGYLVVQDFGFEHPRLSTNLVRTSVYAGNGFYLRTENYLEKLPLFAAGKYEFGKRWWENGTIFKCADGGKNYAKDRELLKACLIFTSLSYFNKCRSFNGSDSHFYKNELCFDKGTLASQKITDYKLSREEVNLIEIFNDILNLAKKTNNYDSRFAYGVYQIDQDLNTYKRDETNTKIYDYPLLNTEMINLKAELSKYYEATIMPRLFKYELLK